MHCRLMSEPPATVVLVGIFVAFFLPGESSVEFYAHHEVLGGGRYNFCYAVEHGWPLTYLIRRDVPWQDEEVLNLWALWDRPSEFRPWFLVADLVIGIAVLTIACLVLEWWQRKRRSFFQFGLKSLLVGMCLFCVGLAWWVYETNSARSCAGCLEELEGCSPFTEWDEGELRPNVPEWLSDLANDDAFQ